MTITGDFRLPRKAVPIRYEITIVPVLGTFEFWGEEEIILDVKERTPAVVLNTVELLIQEAKIYQKGRWFPAKQIVLDGEKERVTISFDHDLLVGEAKLRLIFLGKISDKLRGFYRMQYELPSGEKRWGGMTQFEATDARRAFPCFDEPDFKAQFRLTLHIPQNLTAISNTPITSTRSAGNGVKRIRFAETPRMSTYLLAFAIGEFESISARTANGTKVSVWATPGKKEQGRFALEIACKLLPFYEEYFGIRYPLPKLDLIAAPDFESGAMENWGIVTFRETAILRDEKKSSAANRQRVAIVVAHELAHMWFGNLVTMAWWTHLWLNESFAEWCSTNALDHLFPMWRIWTIYQTESTGAALKLDGLKSSHPIEVEVKDPSEIDGIFDEISYEKGGSFIRMLEHFLGSEVFRQGLQAYMRAHEFGNAATEDLWEAMEKASGQPVREIAGRWTSQTGYPVIQANREVVNGKLTLKLSQNRFLYDGATDETLWPVPIIIAFAGGKEPIFRLMSKQTETISLDEADTNAWVKVNFGQTGFFRVNYDQKGWQRLAVGVSELPEIDRLGLQSDAFAMVKAGHLPATRYLELLTAYRTEKSFTVWRDIITNLAELEDLLTGTPYIAEFEAFVRELLEEIVAHVGWEPKPEEGHLDALLRPTVLSAAGRYGNMQVLDEAGQRMIRFLDDPATLNPDLHSTIINLVAKRGDEKVYEILVNLHRHCSLQEEKMRYLASLGHFDKPELLARALEFSLSPEVRSQDTVLGIIKVAANPAGRVLAWEFVKANWPEFNRRYGAGHLMPYLIEATTKFTDQEKEENISTFFQKNPVPSAKRALEQALERIRLNRIWLEQNRADLEEWFRKERDK